MMIKREGIPQPFGAHAEKDKVNFAVQVPRGQKCELLLYRAGKNIPEIVFEMPEEEGIGEVRYLAVEGKNISRYEYNYRINKKVCMDPYVKEIAGKKAFGIRQNLQEHEIRGKIVPSGYDWNGDKRLHIPWNEVVAYSLHVRGFTKHSSSKVAHKGTFLGVTEKIPYLKELGINQIQCMPVYEFEEYVNGQINYWGYGEGYYFAPKHSYAAGKNASTELKDMVRACHEAGIEVVLEMPFGEKTSVQTALECLKFYMMEYHIDGFVVNPYSVPWDILNADPFLKDIKLMRKDDGYQNVMRRFLKGDENMVNDVMWALEHNSAEDGKCNYITGHTGFTLWDLVSYDGKHNEGNGERNQDGPEFNYSWNCGAEGPSRKKAVMALRKNQAENAFTLLLTSQGTPCLLAGDEFYNSQKGNNNVYCQDNETAWVNWSRLKTDDSLFRHVKSLIGFRKEHGCLHRRDGLKGMDRNGCGMPDVSFHGEYAWRAMTDVASRQLGAMYAAEGEKDEACFIAYNMHWIPHPFALPSPGKGKKWMLAGTTADGILEKPEPLEEQKIIELKERSISLLVSRKKSEIDEGI